MNFLSRLNFWLLPPPLVWKETVFKEQEPFLPFPGRFIPEVRETRNIDLLFEVLKAKYIQAKQN